MVDERGARAAVSEVDERPIERGGFSVGERSYTAAPPLRFNVAFNRGDRLYELAGEFDIVLTSATRAELKKLLDDTLRMLWREYAEEDPAALSPKALELRRQLRSRVGRGYDGGLGKL